jgi:hypothetical protein
LLYADPDSEGYVETSNVDVNSTSRRRRRPSARTTGTGAARTKDEGTGADRTSSNRQIDQTGDRDTQSTLDFRQFLLCQLFCTELREIKRIHKILL